jgi:hypothetical protein
LAVIITSILVILLFAAGLQYATARCSSRKHSKACAT